MSQDMRGKANYTGENYNRTDSNEGLELEPTTDKYQNTKAIEEVDEVLAVSNPIS